MTNLFRNRTAFALIELMVIVAILSMTAAFFVPRFLKHRIEKKRGECRKNLETLYEAEKNYFEKNGRYATDQETLGWTPRSGGVYSYHFLPSPSSSAQKPSFIFECLGNIDKDATLDQAQIDETGHITQTIDDTRK